jgi:L-threonylcarbamoyladenylate synthase
MQLTTVKPENLDQARQTARQAADILLAGGLVVFPTETVYGVGASAADSTGYEALRAIKDHPEGRAFTVHLSDPAAADRFVDTSSPVFRRLMRKVFPGPVTLVADVSEDVIRDKLKELRLPPEARDRLYFENAVGLRCPDHPLAQLILGSLDAPVLAGSANRPGGAPPHDAAEAAAAIGDRVGLIVDGGPTRYSKPSTLVRVRGSGSDLKINVERAGVYDDRFIHKLLRWTMLVICSGNTCRSPMAEGLAKHMLAEQRKIGIDDLETAGLRVISAGAFAAPGLPASPEAVDSMKKFGVDLTRHRSRALSNELIHEADVIYCMTQTHRQAVLNMSGAAEEKTFLLDANGDIEDPIGADLTAYQRCAERIRRRLAQRLKEQLP